MWSRAPGTSRNFVSISNLSEISFPSASAWPFAQGKDQTLKLPRFGQTRTFVNLVCLKRGLSPQKREWDRERKKKGGRKEKGREGTENKGRDQRFCSPSTEAKRHLRACFHLFLTREFIPRSVPAPVAFFIFPP